MSMKREAAFFTFAVLVGCLGLGLDCGQSESCFMEKAIRCERGAKITSTDRDPTPAYLEVLGKEDGKCKILYRTYPSPVYPEPPKKYICYLGPYNEEHKEGELPAEVYRINMYAEENASLDYRRMCASLDLALEDETFID